MEKECARCYRYNIPEDFAIGVMFGAIASSAGSVTVASAVILAIGIGIQNIPEGAAVSMPLRREGVSSRICCNDDTGCCLYLVLRS